MIWKWISYEFSSLFFWCCKFSCFPRTHFFLSGFQYVEINFLADFRVGVMRYDGWWRPCPTRQLIEFASDSLLLFWNQNYTHTQRWPNESNTLFSSLWFLFSLCFVRRRWSPNFAAPTCGRPIQIWDNKKQTTQETHNSNRHTGCLFGLYWTQHGEICQQSEMPVEKGMCKSKQ